MQEVWAGVGDRVTRLELPDPDEVVVPGVQWGRPEVPFTPAYWAARILMNPGYCTNSCSLCRSGRGRSGTAFRGSAHGG